MKDIDMMVVAVSEYSFRKALEDHYYAFPSEYRRDMNKKYIAFYRPTPIKAITHYSRIEEVKISDTDNFSVKDRLLMFGHRADKKIIVFVLEPLIELDAQIDAKGRSIQGCKYSSLKRLLNAKTLNDI
jgi:hypothetical protein